MHYHWGQTAAKKGTRPLWTAQRTSTKKQCNLCGWLERQQCGLHSFFWILSTLEICSVLEQSWKKVYSRTTTKSIPLLLTFDCTTEGSKIYEVVLLNIFVQLFWSQFDFFFLVFPSRKLSVTFAIQIDLKLKHL